MLMDIYSKHIPSKCPNCNTYWKYPSCAYYGTPMIAVCLDDVIDITCSKCRRDFIVDKEKIHVLLKDIAIHPNEL